MTLFADAISLAQKHPIAESWPVLLAGLEETKTKEAASWELPAIGCEAFGGRRHDALPAIASMVCAQISILLIDDMLDQDPRGRYHKIGEGRAANLAATYASLAIALLMDDANNPNRLAAAGAMSRMIANVAHGQAMDVENQATEAAYWEVTHYKSGHYFATGLYLGALYAGVEPEAAERFHQFGLTYGETMQIHDDLNDCLHSPANPDWLTGRYPLPILFAEVVDHPQRQRFVELRAQAADEAALEEAQAILVSCGAISYAVHELIERYKKAKGMLPAIEATNAAPLEQLLEEIITPVKRLLETVGAAWPEEED